MGNSLCFGKWYSGEAQECRPCEVREECSLAMQSERKMPCFGQYELSNWACIDACHLGGQPDKSVCAAKARGSEIVSDTEELMEEIQMVEKVESPSAGQPVEAQPVEAQPVEAQPVEAQPVEAQPTEAQPVEAQPTEAQPAEAQPAAAQPAEPPPGVPGKIPAPSTGKPPVDKPKKISKKGIIRDTLAETPPGISADDIVQRIMDAGLATEDQVDKTRHYVIMSISHMRSAGTDITLKEGKYAVVGDQSK